MATSAKQGQLSALPAPPNPDAFFVTWDKIRLKCAVWSRNPVDQALQKSPDADVLIREPLCF